MFASLAGTTDMVAVKVECVQLVKLYPFLFGHLGVVQLAELTNLVGADRKKVNA